jgi:tetratricopeptide (TPR) repeat protein
MQHRQGGIASTLFLFLGLTVCLTVTALPIAAQQDDAAPDATTEQDDKEARREAKRLAREARIEEYLLKKEERLAQRELERRAKEEQQAVDLATFANEGAADVEAQQATTQKKTKKNTAKSNQTSGGSTAVVLPKNLARVQQIVRSGPLGDDPTVQGYLDLIDRADASPHQLAAFGSFLADSGWAIGAIEYYNVALKLEPADPLLWINAGTIHRQLGDNKSAIDAYRRALSIDPNLADAHYNLGAALGQAGRLDEAEEHRDRAHDIMLRATARAAPLQAPR